MNRNSIHGQSDRVHNHERFSNNPETRVMCGPPLSNVLYVFLLFTYFWFYLHSYTVYPQKKISYVHLYLPSTLITSYNGLFIALWSHCSWSLRCFGFLHPHQGLHDFAIAMLVSNMHQPSCEAKEQKLRLRLEQAAEENVVNRNIWSIHRIICQMLGLLLSFWLRCWGYAHLPELWLPLCVLSCATSKGYKIAWLTNELGLPSDKQWINTTY